MTTAYTGAANGTGAAKRACGAASLLAVSCLVLGGGAAAAGEVPTAAQVLMFRPRQAGVSYTTPDPDKLASCKVDFVRDQPRGGWLLTLKDGGGNLLRRFVDTNGDNRPDVWAYYKDGAEVYREIDSAFTGKPDQYRWLNAGGMRWGYDQDKDGRIDYWKAISAEEVSQEVLQALITKDFARLRALMISEGEIKALELPADLANRIREEQKAAPARFQEAVSKLTKLGPKTTWLHLETAAPQCLPADQTGSRYDLVKHARGTLMYESGGTSDGIQTGEMILVGTAWRLTGAPTPGAGYVEGGAPATGPAEDPKVAKLLEELSDLDKKNQAPGAADAAGADPKVARYHLDRADLLEKIVAAVKPQDRDPWIRQVADSLSTAAQKSPPGDKAAFNRLTSLEKQLASAMPPGSNLPGYVTFREIQADYAIRSAAKANDPKLQEYYLDRLAKFVQAYPKADDTPDVLLQLGLTNEILSKEVESKSWYNQVVRNFADKPQAAKARGALARLELEGKPLQLAGPTLPDPNVAFDVAELRGKVVVVYYWASWNTQAPGEFAKLKALLDANKGVALVSVNLDNTIEEARGYLQRAPAPGTHLFQAGGLEGKLATDYGIQALPTMFLVGKDGKVVSRNMQIGNLEEEIKKQLK